MSRFRTGQIVLAYIDDGRGHTKERPCMILTTDSDLQAGEPIQVIAITKSIEDPKPYWVPVPHKRPRHPQTGLSEPSVAKCNWIREIEERRIIKSLGDMPDDEFEMILNWFEWLDENAESIDWI